MPNNGGLPSFRWHLAGLRIICSGCCTNADRGVLSRGTVVGSSVARLEAAFPDRTSIYVVMSRSRWRLAKGLHEAIHTSTDLVGGRVIAGLSVQMVPNSMGVDIYL